MQHSDILVRFLKNIKENKCVRKSPCVCRNELYNPRCFTVSVNSAESLFTVRQLGKKVLYGIHRGCWN